MTPATIPTIPMSPLWRRLLPVAVLIGFALPAVAAAQTRTPGFQLQADGVLYSPHGSVEAAGGAKLQDLVSTGPGFALTASLGLMRRWAVAARVAYFGSEKDGRFQFVDDLNTNGQLYTDGVGPYDLSRRLRATAVHGLLQYRQGIAKRVELALEAGGGVVSARERLVLASATGEKASAVGVQLDPSYALGAALAVQSGWNTDVVGGARWMGSFSGDGAVWSQGDSPGYLHWTLGVRYPHDTH